MRTRKQTTWRRTRKALAGLVVAIPCAVATCDAGESVVEMLPGVVKPSQAAELTPSIEGVLEVLHVSEGEWVEAGDVLATVDRRLAEANLQQAEFEAQRTAAVELASTRVELARKYLARIEQAHAKEAASDLELDEAQGRVSESLAALKEANEQISAARHQLAAARAQHAAHELCTPISGEVIRIRAKHGEMVQRSAVLVSVVNLNELSVDLYVPTRLLPLLKVGQKYTLSAEAPVSHDIEAKLIYREPVIDAATDTFRCRLVIDNHSLGLPAGFAVRLRQPPSLSSGAEPIARAR